MATRVTEKTPLLTPTQTSVQEPTERIMANVAAASRSQQSTPAIQNAAALTTLKMRGGKYVGQVQEGKPHGWGKLKFRTGEVYEGNWEDGCRHGRGMCTYAKGQDMLTYEGAWETDLPSGPGVGVWRNGNHYEGEWKDGYPHGEGILRHGESETRGTFQKGKIWNGKTSVCPLDITWENGVGRTCCNCLIL